MKLKQSILEVTQITARLRSTLTEGDLPACTALMDERAASIKSLLRVHGDATDSEIRGCAALLADLRLADQELQEFGQTTLDSVARDWNRAQGQTSSPRHDYDRSPELACLDRKA